MVQKVKFLQKIIFSLKQFLRPLKLFLMAIYWKINTLIFHFFDLWMRAFLMFLRWFILSWIQSALILKKHFDGPSQTSLILFQWNFFSDSKGNLSCPCFSLSILQLLLQLIFLFIQSSGLLLPSLSTFLWPNLSVLQWLHSFLSAIF